MDEFSDDEELVIISWRALDNTRIVIDIGTEDSFSVDLMSLESIISAIERISSVPNNSIGVAQILILLESQRRHMI